MRARLGKLARPLLVARAPAAAACTPNAVGLRALSAAAGSTGRTAGSLGDALNKVVADSAEANKAGKKWEYVPDAAGPKADTSEDSSLEGLLDAMEREMQASSGSAPDEPATGRVISVEGGVARIAGMTGARMGEAVAFGPEGGAAGGGGQGLVVGLEAKRTVVAVATEFQVVAGKSCPHPLYISFAILHTKQTGGGWLQAALPRGRLQP
jgi:hypothetical protein